MNSRRVSILLSVVTVAAAFTPAPDTFWQPDVIPQDNQWGLWSQPQANQLMMPPFPIQAPPSTAQNLQKEPQISLDQIYKMVFPGADLGSQTAGAGNTGIPTTGAGSNVEQFAFPFLQFLQPQTTPKPTTTTTTTTTTPKPTTTTTTTTTTPEPTTTTTRKPTTWSPKMKLSDILLLQALRAETKNGGKNKPTTPGPRGCLHKDKWYAPLTQIDRGQIGDWCWGSYCNHESKIVHWDDQRCTIPTTPPTTTQDPNQFGCFYNGQWFAPGADIDNYREYGKCFGTYCDYNSRLQHWEDRCIATVAPQMGHPGAGPGVMGMSGMSGMNMMGLISKKK